MQLIPTGCSYHTEGYDSWLDIIATNSLHLIKYFLRSAIPFANGHDLLNFEIQFLDNKTEEKTYECRDWKNCNYTELGISIEHRLRDFFTFNLNAEYKIETSSLVETFYQVVTNNLNKFAPIIKKWVKRKNLPWIETESRIRMKQRDELYSIYKISNNKRYLISYRQTRNSLKQYVKSARDKYI